MEPSSSDTVTIRHAQVIWLFVFSPVLILVLAGLLWATQIGVVWWVVLSIALSAAIIAAALRRPYSYSFDGSTKIFEVGCLLTRGPKQFRFNEIDFIQTYATTVRESEPCVRLEIRMKNGRRYAIKEAAPESNGKFSVGLSWCKEPEELAILRRQISQVSGIKDLGFC